MSKFKVYANRYGEQINLYPQQFYQFDLLHNDFCYCIKVILDNKEYIIGHNYETINIAKFHARSVIANMLLNAKVYKVTCENPTKYSFELVYSDDAYFNNTVIRNAKLIKKQNSNLQTGELKTLGVTDLNTLI